MIYINEDFLRLTWLLVPLGENFVEGCTNDGPLELVGPLGPLFGGLLLNTLPVLASVEDGPCHLPGVALEHVCLLGTTIQETESLKIKGNLSFIRKNIGPLLACNNRYSSALRNRTIVKSTEYTQFLLIGTRLVSLEKIGDSSVFCGK